MLAWVVSRMKKGTPVPYCTRNGLGLIVGALPSRPSAQAYQVPAVAGVGA
jgi:hypothetical protein